MDGISGSANSLIELGMAMSQVRVQSAMPISAIKKGLDAQVQTAMSLIEMVQQVSPPPAGGGGSQVDVIA